MFSNDSADVNDNYYLCVKGFNRQKEVALIWAQIQIQMKIRPE